MSRPKVDDAVAHLSRLIGRAGRTEDICGAVLWLTSPRASYSTGTVLSVDGGLALGGSSAIAAAPQAEIIP